MASTQAMSEDALIRLENLRRLKIKPRDLTEKLGSRVSYWSDLLSGKKSFGEKVARKIEDGLGLQRLSLDAPLIQFGAIPQDYKQNQPLAIIEKAPVAINIDDAVKVLADAISASPAIGSDVLIGALTSLAKDPDRVMHRQVLTAIIQADNQSSQLAA